MEEKPFRVLLDMTEINVGETELKYVWMYVSPRELKTIFDFKSAIINKFPFIQENFKLFVRDGLVPESEKIAILREDDSVKLQYEYSSQSFANYSRRSTVQVVANLSNGEQMHCDSGSSKESRKRKTNEFINSLTEKSPSLKQHKKKKKRDKSPNKSCVENLNDFEREETALNNPSDLSSVPVNLPQEKCSQQISQSNRNTESTDDENPVKVLHVSKNSKSQMFTSDDIEYSQNTSGMCKISNSCQTNSSSKNINNTSVSSNMDISLEAPSKMNLDEVPRESHSKKRKRRRKRKRKESANATESCLLEDVPACEMEICFQSDVASKARDSSSDIRKHVIYHSPTPPKITDTEILYSNVDDPQITQPSVVEVEENFAEISELDACVAKFMQQDTYMKFATKSKSDFVLSEAGVSPRVSTPFSKRKLKGQSWGITPLQKIGSATSNTFTVKNSNTSKNERAEKLPYVDCTPLNYLPPVGTRLAYKTLELNENYCPEVTEYKEGILKKIDPSTDELEIELIHEEVKPGRIGKFENLREDEIPPPQVIKTVHLNWTALIEPRIISQQICD